MAEIREFIEPSISRGNLSLFLTPLELANLKVVGLVPPTLDFAAISLLYKVLIVDLDTNLENRDGHRDLPLIEAVSEQTDYGYKYDDRGLMRVEYGLSAIKRTPIAFTSTTRYQIASDNEEGTVVTSHPFKLQIPGQKEKDKIENHDTVLPTMALFRGLNVFQRLAMVDASNFLVKTRNLPAAILEAARLVLLRDYFVRHGGTKELYDYVRKHDLTLIYFDMIFNKTIHWGSDKGALLASK